MSMRKIYLQPEIEIIRIVVAPIMDGSNGWSQDGGETIVVDEDPTGDDEFLDLD